MLASTEADKLIIGSNLQCAVLWVRSSTGPFYTAISGWSLKRHL